jgi:hypothetical protein
LKVFWRQRVFVAFFALLFGCYHIKYPPYKPSVPITDLVGMVRESRSQIHSLRGIGRIEVVSQGKRVRTRQFIVLAKPDMMRVDLLHFMDLPYLRLAFRGDTFQALDMRENVFYTGRVVKGLSLFVPLRLTSREFIAFVFGEIPSQEYLSARYDPARRLYQLTFPPSTRWESQTFWIHPKTLRIVEASKTAASEGEVIRIFFSRFRKVGAMNFPAEILLEVSGIGSRIKLDFRKIEVNPSLSPELFRLSVPPGVEVVEITDEVGPFTPIPLR